MAAGLTDLITTTTETITADMNNKWEQYIEYIKKTSKYEAVTIDTAHAFANIFDLNAIFTKIGIQERYFYPMLRLNGYKSPTDFDGNNKEIKIYPANTLDSFYLKIIAS